MPPANRLALETSPYLLQHAYNPVDWYPWGDEALQKAIEEQKPILVSIGYSACHWCHVMERESFEDEATAAIMNAHFINIKIDREERPDIDHIYMDAIQAMTGSGGWPLNVFLTPDKRPFYGGTYFPPERAYNRASWKEVLHGVAGAWKERRHEIEAQAENLTSHLREVNKPGNAIQAVQVEPGKQLFIAEHCRSIYEKLMQQADRVWGGFGRAPKFPQTFSIGFLLEHFHFTQNREALDQALLSLDKMLQGGIYDHLAGGLARYSTDNEWLAPHFEKMLYDNALLLDVLCAAWQITRQEKYALAIRKTIGFVENELMGKQGGFYSALDADSEGEEGRYYVWSKSAIEAILGNDAGIFCEFFNITENGNWEHQNILRILVPREEFIVSKSLDAAEFDRIIETGIQLLLKERWKRVRPSLDDKVILGWNALMVKALSKAAIALEDKVLGNLAEANMQFLIENLRKGGEGVTLMHTCKNGQSKIPAFLDDYALLAEASLSLYEYGFRESYLQLCFDLLQHISGHFSDENNLFFYFTAASQEDVIVRKKEIHDGAMPSGNAVMAGLLIKGGLLFGRQDWRERGEKMLESMAGMTVKYPGSFGRWATLIQQQAVGINELAIIGPGYEKLSSQLCSSFIPNKVIMASGGGNEAYPLLSKRGDLPGTWIYLCRNYTCDVPVDRPELIIEKIKQNVKIALPQHNI